MVIPTPTTNELIHRLESGEVSQEIFREVNCAISQRPQYDSRMVELSAMIGVQQKGFKPSLQVASTELARIRDYLVLLDKLSCLKETIMFDMIVSLQKEVMSLKAMVKEKT